MSPISDPISCVPDTLYLRNRRNKVFHDDPYELQKFIHLSDSALFWKLPKSKKYLFDLDFFLNVTLKYFKGFCKHKKIQRIILYHTSTNQH